MKSQAPGNRASINKLPYFKSSLLSSLSHTQKWAWLLALLPWHSPPHTKIHAYVFFPSFSFSPLTFFRACTICFSSSSGIILPLRDTDLKRRLCLAVNTHWCCFFKSMNFPLRPPTYRILSPLPSICFHKANILCTNPKKGGCLLHGVMTLN